MQDGSRTHIMSCDVACVMEQNFLLEGRLHASNRHMLKDFNSKILNLANVHKSMLS